MDREKQVEEMAKIIARRSKNFRDPNVAFMTTATKTANSLYASGYRKHSDVVKEIFAYILSNHTPDIDGFFTMHESEFKELKKEIHEGIGK